MNFNAKSFFTNQVIQLLSVCILYFSCQTNQESITGLVSDQSNHKEITEPEDTEIWEPISLKVSVSDAGIPSDAIVLFDGSNLDQWKNAKDETPATWLLNDDSSMTVKDKSGDIQTKQDFGSVQLHIEWRNPAEPRADGQNRGNSGVYFQKRYEVQVLDNYDNPTYVNGQVASVYKQHSPLVNASKPSGEWQTYDMIFHEPEFDADGQKTKSATLTVIHNGVLVQDHVEIYGTTEYIGLPKNEAHGKGPILLQDHGDKSGVSYRNIWLREL